MLMKIFGMAAMIGGCMLVNTACRLDRPDPLPQGPVYSVLLDLEKESVEEHDRPIGATKAEEKDIYAVQVYKGLLKYAYGIFDDPAQMRLELEEGKSYKIEVTVIERATALLASAGSGMYGAPFDLGGVGAGPGKITNTFIKNKTGSNVGMNNLTKGTTALPEGNGVKEYDRPPVSRFYGVVEGIQPEEGMRIKIPLKWVCFALTVQPQDFLEGTLEIEMEGAPKLTIAAGEPEAVTQKVFCFAHLTKSDGDWREEEYQETVPTTIRWIKADGTEVLLRENAPFIFKRKFEKILQVVCGDEPNDGLLTEKEEVTLQPEEPEIIRPAD